LAAGYSAFSFHMSSSPAGRGRIFDLRLRKRNSPPDRFDLDALAGAKSGFSGAEIEQALIASLFTAFAHRRSLTTAILLDQIRATRPLSRTMAEQPESLRRWARDRTVVADGSEASPAQASNPAFAEL